MAGYPSPELQGVFDSVAKADGLIARQSAHMGLVRRTSRSPIPY
jgi:hypothetical protein